MEATGDTSARSGPALKRPVVDRHYEYPDTMFDVRVYPKGAWILHMLGHRHPDIEAAIKARAELGVHAPVVRLVATGAVRGEELLTACGERRIDRKGVDRCRQAVDPLAPAAAPDLQSLFAVEPAQLLVVHGDPLPCKQHMQAPVTEPATVRRQLAQPLPQSGIVTPPVAIAHQRTFDAEDRARPPLAHPMRLARTGDRGPPSSGRHHFFAATSFSTALSSIASASSFLSLAFSSSSALSRRACDTSSPPYLAFQL